jgi:hypothetical protein
MSATETGVELDVQIVVEDALTFWQADDAPEPVLDDALAALRHSQMHEIAAQLGSGRYLLAAVPLVQWALPFWHAWSAAFDEVLLVSGDFVWFAFCAMSERVTIPQERPAYARLVADDAYRNCARWCFRAPLEATALEPRFAHAGAFVVRTPSGEHAGIAAWKDAA